MCPIDFIKCMLSAALPQDGCNSACTVRSLIRQPAQLWVGLHGTYCSGRYPHRHVINTKTKQGPIWHSVAIRCLWRCSVSISCASVLQAQHAAPPQQQAGVERIPASLRRRRAAAAAAAAAVEAAAQDSGSEADSEVSTTAIAIHANCSHPPYHCKWVLCSKSALPCAVQMPQQMPTFVAAPWKPQMLSRSCPLSKPTR